MRKIFGISIGIVIVILFLTFGIDSMKEKGFFKTVATLACLNGEAIQQPYIDPESFNVEVGFIPIKKSIDSKNMQAKSFSYDEVLNETSKKFRLEDGDYWWSIRYDDIIVVGNSLENTETSADTQETIHKGYSQLHADGAHDMNLTYNAESISSRMINIAVLNFVNKKNKPIHLENVEITSPVDYQVIQASKNGEYYVFFSDALLSDPVVTINISTPLSEPQTIEVDFSKHRVQTEKIKIKE